MAMSMLFGAPHPTDSAVRSQTRVHGPVAERTAEGVSMKRSLMGGLLLLAAVAVHAQQSEKAVVEQIRKLDQERINAQVTADAAALDRIYADDFIGIGPSGTVRTKKEVLADFASGSLKFQSITTDDVRIR